MSATHATPARRDYNLIAFAILIAALLVAPMFLYPLFLMKVLCFALFALAFNLLIGYVGLLSFGHAMFFGGASYICAHAMKVWGFTPELGLLAGTGAALILGVIAGAIAIRRQGIYFAMVTLALAQMIYFYALQAPFTGGEDGIQAVPRRALFGVFDMSADLRVYYLVLAVFAAGFLIIYRTIHSPFGQVLKAIRENEPRAISLGYPVDRFKLIAFVLSATLAGLAGATKVLVFQLASLTDVQWQMSGEVVLMTLVGGMGTVFGPIVGAAVIISMQNYLAHLGEWVTIIQGAIFVVVVLLFRRGIVGEIVARVRRRGTSDPAAPAGGAVVAGGAGSATAGSGHRPAPAGGRPSGSGR
ncbi:MAG TPA: branched-chain amino acid ABC transporter permease [Burkholderiaceae bacterium]|nr:branched-chain amino acid ABC transporter permease [Burkholderiaceae bacterium]